MNSSFQESFLTKYKPYYVKDFTLEEAHLTYLKTLLDLDDFNLLCVGNVHSGKTTFLYALIRYYYGWDKAVPIEETNRNLLLIHTLKEQGIHFFRHEMKTFCQSRSNLPGKKKMIVVDDLDTLPQQSQQIFCNYMDKYQNNVVFISVCSNVQKVIESIQSRLHSFPLSSPTEDYLHRFLNKILCSEPDLKLDGETRDLVIDFILKMSQGSPRNIINMLEKLCILRHPITLDLCKSVSMGISNDFWERYVMSLQTHSLQKAIQIIYEIYDYGYSVIDILDSFFTFIKLTPEMEDTQKYQMIPIVCHYITLFHTLHEESIELAFFTQDLMGTFV